MLWYKAWLETRARFLACLAGTTIIVAFFVHHAESIVLWRNANSSNNVAFFAQGYLVGIWILCVVLLGMGGLMREKAVGASSFTLALPVTRKRLMGVRIAVGLLQAVSLAAVPWTAILLLSWLAGSPFSVLQAGHYVSLLISGGVVYFAFAILISSVIEGEYTAPSIVYGLTILTGLLFGNVEWLKPYVDIWRLMGGDNHIDKQTFVLTGSFPWTGAVACVCIAAAMLLASVSIINRHEF